ncbi:GIY-YIG catalytic domain-containing protein [Maricaulis salignorans]|uniref:GIY-YIG catalytic domain-containing protein n=2 Tax=Maricaulis salignorans TaxID=144026 RepID=A0A1G9X1J7_9PROT|nr:GIY-YIG nuclease family protein [Maricaulis salignorans]SDM90578.1 GIY-YIG catalytic domain-containing protein [Maricaulis salignorans]
MAVRQIARYNCTMTYVYILRSECGQHFYTGMTTDLEARLERHNAGQVRHTAKFRPWRIQTHIGFDDSARALAFERYLKTGSGRAFARRHL